MRKKIMALLMAFALIIVGTTTTLATTATAELQPSSTTVKAGDTFTIMLSLTTDQPFETIGGDQNGGRDNDSFALNYDASKLELVNQEVVATNVMDLGIDVDETTGEEERVTDKVLLLAMSGIRTGDLYKWTFRVKSDAESGNTQISTTSIIGTDFSDEETTIQTNPLTITIEANSSTSGQEQGGETQNNNSETTDGQESSNNNSGTSTEENNSSNVENNTSAQDNKAEGSSSSTNGNASGKTTKESTTGQSGDTTTAASAGKIIPAAGLDIIIALLIVGTATIGIVAHKKYDQLKDIK